MTVFLAVCAVLAVLLLDALLRPWAPCPLCSGRGRHGLSSSWAWGDCPFCKGRGKRLRVGARMVRRVTGRREP